MTVFTLGKIMKERKLGELADIFVGPNILKSDLVEQLDKKKWCLISNKNIGLCGELQLSDEDVVYDIEDRFSKFELFENDILLSIKGVLGRSALVTEDVAEKGCICSGNLCVLRCRGEAVDAYVLLAFLQNSIFENILNNHCFGSVQKSLTKKFISEIQFPEITKPNQKKIAELYFAHAKWRKQLIDLNDSAGKLVDVKISSLLEAQG